MYDLHKNEQMKNCSDAAEISSKDVFLPDSRNNVTGKHKAGTQRPSPKSKKSGNHAKLMKGNKKMYDNVHMLE